MYVRKNINTFLFSINRFNTMESRVNHDSSSRNQDGIKENGSFYREGGETRTRNVLNLIQCMYPRSNRYSQGRNQFRGKNRGFKNRRTEISNEIAIIAEIENYTIGDNAKMD